MKITIEVDGITREYQGEYHGLHVMDWNKEVCDMLNTVNENNNEKN